MPMRKSSGLMAQVCSVPSMPTHLLASYVRCPPFKFCDRSGFRTSHGARTRSTGVLLRIFLRLHATSDRPMTLRLITAKSVVLPGWDTRFILRKRVKRMRLISSLMSKRLLLRFPMMQEQDSFMKVSSTRTYCQSSILWIQAMWMPNCWSRASKSTRLLWWVQLGTTINGKPINNSASMPIIFSLTGKQSKPLAQKDTRAVVGRQPLTIEPTRSSRLNSQPRTVKCVQV